VCPFFDIVNAGGKCGRFPESADQSPLIVFNRAIEMFEAIEPAKITAPTASHPCHPVPSVVLPSAKSNPIQSNPTKSNQTPWQQIEPAAGKPDFRVADYRCFQGRLWL